MRLRETRSVQNLTFKTNIYWKFASISKSQRWIIRFSFGLLRFINGAKLRERFASGFRNKPPSKEGGKSAHTSMEEEDGGEAKMQDHMGDCLHQGKHGNAPWLRTNVRTWCDSKDPPDNLSQTGSKGPVLWSEKLTNYCVRHRSNSHSISDCCHHQGGYQANLLRVTVWGG